MVMVATSAGPRDLSELLSQEGSKRRIVSASSIKATKDWQGLWIEFPNGCAVTIPADLPADFSCGWSQEGTDPVVFSAADGVTIQAKGGALKSNGQYSMGAIAGRGASTFRLYGDLTN